MEPLRPMNLGEILDRTIQIYRSRFLVFVGIAALPALAVMALEMANIFWWRLHLEDTKTLFFNFTVGGLVSMLAFYQISLLLHIVVWPSLIHLTLRSYAGEESTLSTAFLWLTGHWRGMLWMTLALWAAVLVLPEVLSVSTIVGLLSLLYDGLKIDSLTFDKTSPFLVILAAWAFILWFGAPLLFSLPAWSMERLSVWSALRRSWKLSRGSRGRIIFVRIVAPVIGWLLYFALDWLLFLLFSVLLKGLSRQRFFRHHQIGINLFANPVAATLAGPIFPIALTLFYYDQRIQLEGYDIERMMDAAGMMALPNANAIPQAEGTL
jgi:hypothetical protein